MKTLQILSVKSESGDTYGPFLFRNRISGTELLEFLEKHTSKYEVENYVPELDGCPGWMGTNLHISWTWSEVF